MRQLFKVAKAIFLYILGRCRGLFSTSSFGIKGGYRHRKKEVYWDDTSFTDECQKEVYELARFYLDKYGYKNVLDIGCGSGFKLLRYFSDCNTAGVEVDATYKFLKEKYPDRVWINADQAGQMPQKTDIIICADVIEHLINPDDLLKLIKDIHFELLFLSTPERKICRGWLDYGPPANIHHVREWNAKEFSRYIAPHFDILAHMITNVADATQLLICKRKTTT
ncbi:class I SAM-dependent methyltransferase [Longitalea luteola]|uniref:class I SAM-dependent methyltransferase n=1 Tax=Longitalea luteola TaxID=2812563 RepID=UPI001A966C36|nr:class I SAM-dependent methyltransferase [Longitalea luteola]